MVTKWGANKGRGFKNGLLDFAHNNRILGVLLLPLLFDWPAKALQASVRTFKHGDPRLGSAPMAMQIYEPQDGMMGLDLFGAITRQGGSPNEGNTFSPRGDMYRDTSHLNSAKQGPMYGTTNADGYQDTRHLNPGPPRPDFDGGWLHAKGKGHKRDTRPAYGKADQGLTDVVGGGSVFRGISGLGRVRR